MDTEIPYFPTIHPWEAIEKGHLLAAALISNYTCISIIILSDEIWRCIDEN